MIITNVPVFRCCLNRLIIRICLFLIRVVIDLRYIETSWVIVFHIVLWRDRNIDLFYVIISSSNVSFICLGLLIIEVILMFFNWFLWFRIVLLPFIYNTHKTTLLIMFVNYHFGSDRRNKSLFLIFSSGVNFRNLCRSIRNTFKSLIHLDVLLIDFIMMSSRFYSC